MKKHIVILVLLTLTGAIASAKPTGEKQTRDAASKQPAAEQAAKQKLSPQTGSRLQRTVDVSGRITNGPYQLVIINEAAIRRSGASTVAQVLSRTGVRR